MADPTYNPTKMPDMDPNTYELINKMQTRALRPVEDFQKESMSNVKKQADPFKYKPQDQNDLSQALARRSNMITTRGLLKDTALAKNKALLDKTNLSVQAQEFSGELGEQRRLQQYIEQTNRYMAEVQQRNQERAKNQVKSALLGLGGMVVGTGVGAFAGGPSGAMAGGSIGGSLGGALGGDTEMEQAQPTAFQGRRR
jgi:hypothetical protein